MASGGATRATDSLGEHLCKRRPIVRKQVRPCTRAASQRPPGTVHGHARIAIAWAPLVTRNPVGATVTN